MDQRPDRMERVMSEASNLIRDRLAGLSEGERHAGRWEATEEGAWWVKAGSVCVASAGQGSLARPAAEYMALMDPQVAGAVAHLLDILDRVSLLTVVDEQDNEISLDLLDAHLALKAAITGRP